MRVFGRLFQSWEVRIFRGEDIWEAVLELGGEDI